MSSDVDGMSVSLPSYRNKRTAKKYNNYKTEDKILQCMCKMSKNVFIMPVILPSVRSRPKLITFVRQQFFGALSTRHLS